MTTIDPALDEAESAALQRSVAILREAAKSLRV
jgi:hypothetical protein